MPELLRYSHTMRRMCMYVCVRTQAEYTREGVDWRYIEFVDNQEVCTAAPPTHSLSTTHTHTHTQTQTQSAYIKTVR